MRAFVSLLVEHFIYLDTWFFICRTFFICQLGNKQGYKTLRNSDLLFYSYIAELKEYGLFYLSKMIFVESKNIADSQKNYLWCLTRLCLYGGQFSHHSHHEICYLLSFCLSLKSSIIIFHAFVFWNPLGLRA